MDLILLILGLQLILYTISQVKIQAPYSVKRLGYLVLFKIIWWPLTGSIHSWFMHMHSVLFIHPHLFEFLLSAKKQFNVT